MVELLVSGLRIMLLYLVLFIFTTLPFVYIL